MIRNNSYLVHVYHYTKKHGKRNCMTHKVFTLSMIEDFMGKAADLTTVELPRFHHCPLLYVRWEELQLLRDRRSVKDLTQA
eukprot:5275713-Ditylum_brightwellii.AAC.1